MLTFYEYLEKVKQLTDNLVAVGCPVPFNDLVIYTLGSLSIEYEPLIMFVTSQIDHVMLEELQTLLLTQEHRMVLSTHMASLDIFVTPPTANTTTYQPHGTVAAVVAMVRVVGRAILVDKVVYTKVGGVVLLPHLPTALTLAVPNANFAKNRDTLHNSVATILIRLFSCCLLLPQTQLIQLMMAYGFRIPQQPLHQ